MKSVRYLFLLYYYPPILGTAPKRNLNITNALAGRAETTFILTATKNPQRPQENHVRVMHVPAWDYRRWLRKNKRDGALPESGKLSRWAQMMVRFINTFPFNVLIGEGGLLYTWRLIRRGQKLIHKEGITHLYSSFRPFADHYAAYCLKKWNPQLIWIADFRDLMVDPHTRHILFPGAHQHLYKKIFSQADVLTTVSDGLAIHLKAYNQNVVTVRNGIPGELKISQPRKTPFFSMVYTGSMFLEQRNAEPLFMAMHALWTIGHIEKSDIRWIYAGKDGIYWQRMAKLYDMESQLEDHGIIASDEALQLQQDACINVLLTTSSDQLQGVLTGKMIEYFQSGSPVIGIINGQNDPELQGLLNELSIGNTFSARPSDQPAIQSFLLREYQAWKKTGCNHKPVNIEILRHKYSMPAVMEPLYAALATTK